MAESTPFTLRDAAGLPAQPPPLADSALVIIDAQVEYTVGPLALPAVGDAVERIAALIAAARRSGSTIIHVAHQGQAGGLFDLDAGGRIIDAVNPLGDEAVIHKTLPNAFAGTDLDERLRALGRPPLVIVGFMTHMCVSSTARAALDLGHATTVVSDATASRPLPDRVGGPAISADAVHRAALAALADRFSVVVDSSVLL